MTVLSKTQSELHLRFTHMIVKRTGLSAVFCCSSAAFCPAVPHDGCSWAVRADRSSCYCSWQWSSECSSFIITDMVSVYLRCYTLSIAEVTPEFSMLKESWRLFKERRGLQVWRNVGNKERSGVRRRKKRERERGDEEEVCLQTIWTQSLIRNT